MGKKNTMKKRKDTSWMNRQCFEPKCTAVDYSGEALFERNRYWFGDSPCVVDLLLDTALDPNGDPYRSIDRKAVVIRNYYCPDKVYAYANLDDNDTVRCSDSLASTLKTDRWIQKPFLTSLIYKIMMNDLPFRNVYRTTV